MTGLAAPGALTALIIVAVILLLVYRFPILWLPPLITIGKLG